MKRLPLAAALLIFALLLPLAMMSLLLALAGDQPAPSELALEEIPPDLIGTYQSAAATCEGLDWTILAAIHKVETGFGTGRAKSSAGAQGPMQFMPSTFESYGIDGDGDRVARINDLEDAIFSAANLLCANGAGDPARLATAIWNYNHSQKCVNEVLTLASNYGVITMPEGVAHAAARDLLGNPRVVLTPNAERTCRRDSWINDWCHYSRGWPSDTPSASRSSRRAIASTPDPGMSRCTMAELPRTSSLSTASPLVRPIVGLRRWSWSSLS